MYGFAFLIFKLVYLNFMLCFGLKISRNRYFVLLSILLYKIICYLFRLRSVQVHSFSSCWNCSWDFGVYQIVIRSSCNKLEWLTRNKSRWIWFFLNGIFRILVSYGEYRPKKHNLVRTFTDSKKCGARLSCVRSQFREKTIGWWS